MSVEEETTIFYANAIQEANTDILATWKWYSGTLNGPEGKGACYSGIAAVCNGIRMKYGIEPRPDSNFSVGYNESGELDYTPFLWQTSTQPHIPLDEYLPNQKSEPT